MHKHTQVEWVITALLLSLMGVVLSCQSPTGNITAEVISPKPPTIGESVPDLPEPCHCPTCGEKPLLISDPACGLAIGQPHTGSVAIHMGGGEILTVWQTTGAPNYPSLLMERQEGEAWARATFLDEVKARSFAVGSALQVHSHFDVLFCVDTCVAYPNGGVLYGTLPVARQHEGRAFTIKLQREPGEELGDVDLITSFDGATGEWDLIDGKQHFLLFGESSAVRVQSTGTAWITVASHRL